jgi:hypothetical protein
MGTDRNILKPFYPKQRGDDMGHPLSSQLVNSEGGATTNNRGLDKGDWGLKPEQIESARTCFKKKNGGVAKRYVAKRLKPRNIGI